MLLDQARAAVADGCRRLPADRLAVGTSGNVSVRQAGHVAISPTGVAYDELSAGDVCVIDLEGARVDGDLVPSSEWRMHTAVYRARPDVSAIVHAHPVHATATSTLVDELPPVHYLIARLGGPVRVAPYATYGTAELAEASVAALEERTGALLGNHGLTTVGPTLAEAHDRAVLLEWLCAVWLAATGAGRPRLLDDAELGRVMQRLRGYGQPREVPGAQ